MLSDYDVLIIGAGPAGSETAFHFAESGYKTLVVEKESLDREKICGGGLFVQETLEFGPIPAEIIERSIRTLRFNSPKFHRSINLPETLPSGLIVRRSHYDRYLQERAGNAGAQFLSLAAVVDIQYSDDGVFVQVKRDGQLSTFKTRLLIDASGWTSVVARRNNLQLRADDYIASYKCWLELPENVINEYYQDSIEFFFDSEVVPDGYIWIFPKKNVIDVGIGCLAKHLINKKFDLKAKLASFIQNHEILKKSKIVMSKGGYIPCKIYPRLVFDRTLLVGDAGGISSPLHGGGIYYARYSGRCAAENGILFLKSGDPLNLSGYESQIRSNLYELDFKWDERLRPFLAENELVDLLVNSRNKKVDQFFVDLFTGTVPHKEIYKFISETMQDIVAKETPLIGVEDTRDYIPVPTEFTLDAFNEIEPNHVLLVISYCLKNKDCPAGKFSSICSKCNKCSVAGIIAMAERNGIAYYIVTTSESFIEYLDNNHQKFDRLLTISCPAIVNRMALLVNRKYGLEGFSVLLHGDVCRTSAEYSHSEKGAKQTQPYLNLDALRSLLTKISFKLKYS